MHAYKHACIHTYTHAHIHMHTHTHTHTHIHTYTHTHTHTHTHTLIHIYIYMPYMYTIMHMHGTYSTGDRAVLPRVEGYEQGPREIRNISNKKIKKVFSAPTEHLHKHL